MDAEREKLVMDLEMAIETAAFARAAAIERAEAELQKARAAPEPSYVAYARRVLADYDAAHK